MRGRPLALALVVVASALLSLAGSCPTPPPNPQPTPTPSPSMLLSRSGTVFTTVDGKPFDLRVNTSCCWTDDGELDPGWALASKAFIDRIAGFGFNWIHVRLGPYRVQPDWGEEQKSAGSPYLEVSGKADLTMWNPTFWNYVRGFVTHGKEKRVGFEIDLMDGWGLKWQKWKPNQFPRGHPWVRSSNLQNQDWITPAGTRAITPNDVYFNWIYKVVQETGEFDNIFYQVGNEDGQIPGIVAAWETSACGTVHLAEEKYGFKRHLCGSNVPELVANHADIDFLTTHERLPLKQSQCRDLTRPCRNNEMNSPLTGQQWFEFFCAGRASGVYLDFWRAEIRKPEAEKAWTLAQAGCAAAPPPGCSDIPNEDAIQVLPKPPSKYTDQVNAALLRLHPECAVNSNCPISESMQDFLQRFAQEIRGGGTTKLCAGIQTTPEGPVDEACVGTEQECQGQHVYACRPGCATGTVSWAPGSYARASDTWRRPGAAAASATSASAASAASATSPELKPDYKNRRDKIPARGRRPAQPNP